MIRRGKEMTMKEGRTIRQTVASEDLRSVMVTIAEAIGRSLSTPTKVADNLDGLQIRQVVDEGAWGIDGAVEVRSHPVDDRGEIHWISVQVAAAGTRRSPARAAAFARLYQRLADAACLAEAIHCGMLYRFDQSEEAYLAALRQRIADADEAAQ
jgi:hypothetical protein